MEILTMVPVKWACEARHTTAPTVSVRASGTAKATVREQSVLFCVFIPKQGHFQERKGEWSIHEIDLETEARGPALAAAAFEGYARSAKNHCPVSHA